MPSTNNLLVKCDPKEMFASYVLGLFAELR